MYISYLYLLLLNSKFETITETHKTHKDSNLQPTGKSPELLWLRHEGHR